MIIGVDPGKKGGFCCMSDQGMIFALDQMPVDKAGVCKVGIAQLYRKYRSLLDFDDDPKVVIERIFTRPSDAVSVETLKSLVAIRNLADGYLSTGDGGEALRNAISACEVVNPDKIRLDGRTGNLNYAKGAGLLEMCALWGWRIETVSPRTWMKVIKDGAPVRLGPKDQSIFVAKSLWPQLFDKEAEMSFYASKRANAKVLDGLIEAALIAEYGRRKLVVAQPAKLVV